MSYLVSSGFLNNRVHRLQIVMRYVEKMYSSLLSCICIAQTA
jgi:hypothetical protein